MLTGNSLLETRLVRILPHVIDSTLLGAAIALVVMLSINPLATPWLMAKLIALVFYIGLGVFALRRGKTKTLRLGYLIAALTMFLYMVSVAMTKNPAGFLTLLFQL